MEEELKKYLLEQCRDFWLSEESKAMNRLGYVKYNPDAFSIEPAESWIKLDREKLYGIEDEVVNALFELGEKQLEIAIANRIMKDHPKVLNFCPVCGKLTRTPKARQCRHCGHDWHE